MSDEINVTEKIMQLVEQQGKMSTQIDTLTQTVGSMNAKLDKMDKLIKNDTIQDEQIKKVMNDVNTAHEKIRNLTDRVIRLEQSGAQKAKDVLLTVGKYVGVAIVGGIITNAKDIIALLIK